ncbi:MAG: hypothetical protein MR698_11285, partial [Selenomonas sp.]|nr:hypothetical protein [Selenomonas sp.]
PWRGHSFVWIYIVDMHFHILADVFFFDNMNYSSKLFNPTSFVIEPKKNCLISWGKCSSASLWNGSGAKTKAAASPFSLKMPAAGGGTIRERNGRRKSTFSRKTATAR